MAIAGVYKIDRPEGDTLPLIFDSPHSGTRFPPDFQPSVPRDAVLRCADLYVDRLFASAPQAGAVLLAADFPRVYIDTNRAADDLDPSDIEGWSGAANPSEKSRLGKGLIWRRVKPAGLALYDKPLSAGAIMARIDGYYRPYHDALTALIESAHGAVGHVWHIDCHSMQPVSGMMDAEGPQLSRADVVLSDREGQSAAPEFLRTMKESLRAQGLEVAVNQPFKGAEIIRRHGRPADNRHSIQIEINRRLYLNLQTLEPNAQFSQTKAAIDQLIRDLAAFVQASLDS